MATTFPIQTIDGIAIHEAQGGFLWTLRESVGFTKLDSMRLAAVALLVPATRLNDLPALIKRAKRAKGETMTQILRAIGYPMAAPEHAPRVETELMRHIKSGCRIPRCKVCG